MQITFDQIPEVLSKVYEKLNHIESLISKSNDSNPSEKDELLTVEQAAKFLSLSVPTIYGLISKRELPVMKRSKRCYFSSKDLLTYLKQGRKKTSAETSAEANNYISEKPK